MPELIMDRSSLWIVVALVLCILLGYIVYKCAYIIKFKAELRYLNCEIRRTYGDERRYWMRRRCRLWLSWLPFVRYGFKQ